MVSSFEFAENVVGIMIDSDLDQELIESVQARILGKLEDHDKISLFFEIRHGSKMTFTAFVNQMNFNLHHTKSFRKIAVVSDLHWLRNSMVVKNIFMATDIKSFSNKERLEALSWITQ